MNRHAQKLEIESMPNILRIQRALSRSLVPLMMARPSKGFGNHVAELSNHNNIVQASGTRQELRGAIRGHPRFWLDSLNQSPSINRTV
jgi:hypothetical protein